MPPKLRKFYLFVDTPLVDIPFGPAQFWATDIEVERPRTLFRTLLLLWARSALQTTSVAGPQFLSVILSFKGGEVQVKGQGSFL